MQPNTMQPNGMKKPRKRNITRVRHLDWRVRAIIGLHQLGVSDMLTFARALSLRTAKRRTAPFDPAAAALRVAEVIANTHPVVLFGLRVGLPEDAKAKLKNGCTVRCPRCGTNVDQVPCHTCTMRDRAKFPVAAPDDGTDQWLEDWIAEGADAGIPENATVAEPGTPEKLDVMAERFASGKQIHHPGDRSSRYEHWAGEGNMVGAVFSPGFSAYKRVVDQGIDESADEDDLLGW